MAVAGLGSGALVAALPATAAAAAPAERTGFATGMTNATKTMGGAIASAVFAIALSATGSLDSPEEGHAALSGYLTVWTICAVAALLAAGALLMLPKHVAEEPESAVPLVPSNGLGRRWCPMPEPEEQSEPLSREAERAAAAARIQHQTTWVDLQIRQAQERGEFDNLPGAGKPIEGLGAEHDPDWWLKKLVERERIAVLPPSVLPAQGGRRARGSPRPAQRRARRAPRR